MRRSMTLDEIDAAIERWNRRLFRAARAVELLAKARKRVVARHLQNAAATSEVDVPDESADDLSIPAQFLRQPNPKDEAAKAEILAQQEAAKKEKTAARIAKLKADKAGERKRMPLQGKAALAAIRGE